MPKRKPLSKRVRFEVFKRDSFTCQYCGRMSPDVVLQCDHIHPVADGGTNDLLNLVTSCVDCNGGKGARRLDDDSAVTAQREELKRLQARREQLAMMREWRSELRDLRSDEVDVFEDEIESRWGGLALSDHGRRSAARLIDQFSLGELLQAIPIASVYLRQANGSVTQESWENAFGKLGGICYNRRERGEVDAL